MSEIKDNPPPLPPLKGDIEGRIQLKTALNWIATEREAAFARGVAAGQAAMQEKLDAANIHAEYQRKMLSDWVQELEAKLKALEGQKPVAKAEWKDGDIITQLYWSVPMPDGVYDLYLSAGAKHE